MRQDDIAKIRFYCEVLLKSSLAAKAVKLKYFELFLGGKKAMQLLFLLFSLPAIVPPCHADQQGCCSWHKGICGNFCCDGTPFSFACGDAHEISDSKKDCQSEVRTTVNIEQSSAYVSDAEKLLLQDSIVRDHEAYIKARVFDLLETAERELQYALEKTMDKECRKSIEVTIMAIREVENKVAIRFPSLEGRG